MPSPEILKSDIKKDPQNVNFIVFNDMDPSSGVTPTYQLIVSCYYALTTLSTVGYGDYYPVNSLERVIAVVLMLGGVAFFSYIMGNFIEILTSYEKKMGVTDNSGDLNNWVAIVQRFASQPLT